MNDPTILSYNRPLYEEEVTDFGEMILDEYRFDFGVYLSSTNNTLNMFEIPEGVGRIVSYM